jgi:hypothetical protein
MKKFKVIILLLFILITGSICQTNAQYNQYNFGFEDYDENKFPKNWLNWSGKDYTLRIDESVKYNGKASLLIEQTGEKIPNSFGTAGYPVPAIYGGKEIEVRAYMKLENIQNGPIGLMLRIDGNTSSLGFDNMQQKNIQGTSDWTQYSVKLSLPEGAKTIYIGAINSGTGKLWVDDFELLIDGKPFYEAPEKKNIAPDASGVNSINLTSENIQNLTLLGKVWGFLKYYHPEVRKGNIDWDNELFKIMSKVIDSPNKNDRNEILSRWIADIGTFERNQQVKLSDKEIKLTPDLEWIYDKTFLGEKLSGQLSFILNAKREDKNFYISQFEGIGNPDLKNEKPYDHTFYPDAGYRLLGLYRYWNIIQYYFPYKNLIEENWNNVLPEFIPKFANASNEVEYRLAALELIARIHDTHANIWGNDAILENYKGQNYAPIEVKFIDSKAVLTDFLNKDSSQTYGLQIGDIILSINNIPVDNIVKEKLYLTPASNYPSQLRNIAWDLVRTNASSLNVTYVRNGNIETVNIPTSSMVDFSSRFNKKDTCFKFVTPDIAYINPGNIKNEYLPLIMPEVLKSKGLIIDFRTYPSDFVVFTLSEYLLPDEKEFVKFSNGSIESPGLFTFTDILKVGKKNPDYFKGKVVIIINETTQSSAEYHTMAFRTAPNATVIGSITAGADGNVSILYLPGGIKTMISGIGVYYPDGRETQRVGIIPDIEIKPTIRGIKEGRDELLEKAIEIINDSN